MDYSFNTFEPGRHSKTLNRRRQNFFLKKTFDKIGDGIRKGTQKLAGNIVDDVAKKTAKKAGMTPEQQKEFAKKSQEAFYTSGVASKFGNANVKLARDTAIALATLGAGAIASGATGVAGAANAANAAKTASTVGTGLKGSLTLANATKAATAVTGVASALKKKDAAGAVGAVTNSGVMNNVLTPDQQRLIDQQVKNTQQTVKNISDTIPPEVKKQMTNSGRTKIEDVIANNRTSPEILPKTGRQKQIEDDLTFISNTSKKTPPKELDFLTSPIFIGVVVLAFGILIVVMIKK